MMRKVRLELKDRSYDIFIGSGIINRLGKLLKRIKIGEDAFVITNAKIKKLFAAKLKKTLNDYDFSVIFENVADTEKSKSIKEVFRLTKKIASYDRQKRIFIISLGGGVIGDLAGFVASVYKRGVAYIQIPTTLLAQIDSAIGGKVGVDLEEAKNLAGSFYQPRLVLSDLNFLKSLSLKQIKNGLSEVIKYGVITDRQLFEYLEKNYSKILSFREECVEYIVRKCAKIKAEVVQKDEKEKKGIRTILNFGHTIGHAIESAGGYKYYQHGESVAVGMLCAAEISFYLGYCNAIDLIRLEEVIVKFGLPNKISHISLNSILKSYMYDKKFIHKVNRFVLIKEIGKVFVKEDIPQDLIKEVLKKRFF